MISKARLSFVSLLLTLAPRSALAHAHPKSMIPAANSTVSAPSELSVTFSEPLEPKFSKLELLDGSGTVVSKGSSAVDPVDATHMRLFLPKLSTGVYHVHWVSAATDGHRMTGQYTFTVK